MIFEIYEAEKLAAPGRATEELTDIWLENLVEFLLREGCVLEVMRLLMSVQSDGRNLPEELCKQDEQGHTIATSWLGAYLVGQFQNRGNAGKYLVLNILVSSL